MNLSPNDNILHNCMTQLDFGERERERVVLSPVQLYVTTTTRVLLATRSQPHRPPPLISSQSSAPGIYCSPYL